MSQKHDKDSLPRIAAYKPSYHELKAGKSYAWCACGLSQKQPFCDGSHKGTGISPFVYRCETEGEEVLFCQCKWTGTPPFCDGSHNNLLGSYPSDDPESEENRRIPLVAADPDGKARIDGGCFVARCEALAAEEVEGLRIAKVISAEDGAKWQSHFRLETTGSHSPLLSFPGKHCILLVSEGRGRVEICGHRFEIEPEVGVYVGPGEAFRLEAETPCRINAAVSPLADWPAFPAAMPETFDEAFPERCVAIDPDNRQAMGDRFFQMLVDKSVGSTLATQFIGEIPLSKALPHRHLYEESLIVLRGQGMMWTEMAKAEVRTGDVIFLPRKQIHSLECTDPGGMLLAGVIYPGDNPSINY